MVAHALGGNKEQNFPTAVSVASAHNAQFKRLCGSSSALPYISDSIRRCFRSASGRESIFGFLRWARGLFLLLAAGSLSRPVRAPLVDGAARLFSSISVSDEHGQGPATRHRLPDRRDSPVF